MANLTVTAANVARIDGDTEDCMVSAAVTAGQAVARAADGTVAPCAVDSAAHAAVYGIAMNSAPGVGQTVKVLRNGTFNPGATAAVGMPYCAGSSGGIRPVSDITSGDFVTPIGVGVTAASIKLGICASGVAAAADVT